MEKVFLALAVAFLLAACSNVETFNQDDTYLKENAVYISFYTASDTHYVDTTQIRYHSFSLLENKKTYNAVPAVTKSDIFFFFDFSTTYYILPIDPSYTTNTFVLKRANSTVDTFKFDHIYTKLAVNEDESGYKLNIGRPRLVKSTVDTINSYFDSKSQLLYLSLFN